MAYEKCEIRLNECVVICVFEVLIEFDVDAHNGRFLTSLHYGYL